MTVTDAKLELSLKSGRAWVVESAAEGELGLAEPWVVKVLGEAIDAYAPLAKASMILLKEFPKRYRELFAGFEKAGYAKAPSMPAATLELNFKNFEDFMQHQLSKV